MIKKSDFYFEDIILRDGQVGVGRWSPLSRLVACKRADRGDGLGQPQNTPSRYRRNPEGIPWERQGRQPKKYIQDFGLSIWGNGGAPYGGRGCQRRPVPHCRLLGPWAQAAGCTTRWMHPEPMAGTDSRRSI